ncbi:DUF3987 domain-containing protein [Streptomyces hydrogenans]
MTPGACEASEKGHQPIPDQKEKAVTPYRQQDNSGNRARGSSASPGWDDVPDAVAPNGPGGSYYAAEAVLERLTECGFEWREDGAGERKWVAQCPAHGGEKFKLYIAYGTENPDALLFTCFTGECSTEEIAAALGMTVFDFFNRDSDGEAAEEPVADPYEPPKEKRKKPMPEGEPKRVARFDFTDPTDRYLYHVERWEPGRRWNRNAGMWELSREHKSLHFYRKLPSGKKIWSGIFDRTKYEDAPRHTLFNAVAVARAVADGGPVYITEGMSAAKRLMDAYKVTATSLDGGARSQWTPYIVGQLSGAATVYLLMDADESGREWVRNALDALTGRVDELVVLHPATDKAGDDIADHLDAGHAYEDLLEIPLSAFRTPEEEWPEVPVPLEHPDLPALPVEVFGPLVPMIESMAASFQSPPEYAAFNLLGAISSAIGGMVRVQIRQDWSVPHLGLSIAMVGNPSTRKSDNQREAFAPARQAYLELRAGTAEALKEAQRLASKLEKDRAEELIEKLSKAPAGKRPDRLLSALSQTDAEQIPLGAPPKMFFEDVTPEALAEQMAAQGGRAAIVSSEGGAFSMIGGMYTGKGRKTNSDIYRKMYSGEDYTVDRKGTESNYIPMLRGVICVMTQPGTLDGWEEAHPDFRETGLLARFIFTLSPPRTTYSKNPPPVPEGVREQHAQRIDALVWRHWVNGLSYKVERTDCTYYNLTGIAIGVWEPDDPRHQQHTLTLTDAGRAAVVDFDYEINHRIMPGGDLEDVEDAVGKLPERLVRMAACLTLYEDADAVEVDEQHIVNMIRLAPYLIAHGRAAFRKMTKQDRLLGPARNVLDRIKSHTTYGEPFTESEINEAMRHQTSWWSPERGEQAWDVLRRYGWVRKIEDDRKGRSGRRSTKYVAHPLAYNKAHAEAGFSCFSGRIPTEPEMAEKVSRVSRAVSQEPTPRAAQADARKPEQADLARETRETPEERDPVAKRAGSPPARARKATPRRETTPEDKAAAATVRAKRQAQEREQQLCHHLSAFTDDELIDTRTGPWIHAMCPCGHVERHVDTGICDSCTDKELSKRGVTSPEMAPLRETGGRRRNAEQDRQIRALYDQAAKQYGPRLRDNGGPGKEKTLRAIAEEVGRHYNSVRNSLKQTEEVA